MTKNIENQTVKKILKMELTVETEDDNIVTLDFDFKNSKYAELICSIEPDNAEYIEVIEVANIIDAEPDYNDYDYCDVVTPSDYGNTHMIELTVCYDGNQPE